MFKLISKLIRKINDKKYSKLDLSSRILCSKIREYYISILTETDEEKKKELEYQLIELKRLLNQRRK